MQEDLKKNEGWSQNRPTSIGFSRKSDRIREKIKIKMGLNEPKWPPREYQDPSLYQPPTQPFKKDKIEYTKSLYLLNTIYPVLLETVDHALSEGDETHLNPNYKELLDIVAKLLSSWSFEHLASYSPTLPSSLKENLMEWRFEWGDWRRNDAYAFYKILQKEFSLSGKKQYPFPEKIDKALKKLRGIVYGKLDLDKEIIEEVYSSSKPDELEKLTIYPDGKVGFISFEGKTYSTNFRIKSNSFLLLKFLAKNSGTNYNYDNIELNKALKGAKLHYEYADSKERIISTVKEIRKKMGLKKGQLIHTNYGYGIYCSVEFRKNG